MRINGVKTRDRILTVAQDLILEHGYSGTSIDQIIENAAITKGGFFYHFEGKRDLAKNLLIRFLDEDYEISNELLNRAKTLSEDPLQQLLIFLNLMVEQARELPTGHPGCLVASYIYESQQFDSEIHTIAREGIQNWKNLIKASLQTAAEKHPIVLDLELSEIADMLAAVYEGAIVLGKLGNDPNILCTQLSHYRTYIRFIFGDIETDQLAPEKS